MSQVSARDDQPARAPSTIETAERLRPAVLRLSRLLRQVDDSGVEPSVTLALAALRQHGALTMGDLASVEQVSAPTMSRIVDKLVERGFVTRHGDPADRRVTWLKITAAGRKHLDATRARRTRWLAAQLSELTDEQLRRIADAVDVLDAIVDAQIDRRDPLGISTAAPRR